MTTDLRKVAILSNAGCLIGRAIAIALAQRGWHIALLYRDGEAHAQETIHAIEAMNLRAIAMPCEPDAEICAHTLLKKIAETLEIDTHTLVCTVTIPMYLVDESVREFTISSMDKHMHANLGWPVLMARALHDFTPVDTQSVSIHLIDQKSLCRVPESVSYSYSLSQGGMQAAIPMLAHSLAPKTRVIGIASPLNHISPPLPEAQSGGYAASFKPSFAPEDIAATVCFAVESSAITGTILLADGGRHLIPTA